jgi:arginyl-tRNA synthetase
LLPAPAMPRSAVPSSFALVIHQFLQGRLREAIRQVLPEADSSSMLVRPCPDPKFGDYQCNALMSLARERKMNPRQLAADVLAKLEVSEWCEKVELAGAGFINFRLRTAAVAEALQAARRADPPFVEKSRQPRAVVIDFSSPNVAKPMHVGHIRSTVLGDCLSRALRLLGHRVVTDNHIGDWGTQFGMLLVGWKTLLDRAALKSDPLPEMERIYKTISAQCDPAKPGFNQAMLDRARNELVKLQAGDAENLGIWREMIRLSQAQFDTIYTRLGVKFDHTLGESFYHPRLQVVVDELMTKGIATVSEGAKAILSDGSVSPKDDPFLIHKEGKWVSNPFIIQKSDGGFNYATTDLATLAYRLETWRPDEIVYVTDGRQQLHFRQLFATFRRWHPEAKVKLAHVWFGSILGEDGRPFKTRSGDTVKLDELLDEAEDRAFRVVSEKNLELDESERRKIARVVGIGAVKYADLLPNRQSDYVFSWDKILALDGNTAPYLLYAFTRTRSLARKARESGVSAAEVSELTLASAEEIALAKHLLNFGLVLEAVSEEYRPNFLCNYLYELAGLLSRFWEACPVLKSDEPERTSRLILTHLTGEVLQQGLEVLGLQTTDQM